jgi:hypothetical protein
VPESVAGGVDAREDDADARLEARRQPDDVEARLLEEARRRGASDGQLLPVRLDRVGEEPLVLRLLERRAADAGLLEEEDVDLADGLLRIAGRCGVSKPAFRLQILISRDAN